jgi:mannose-6-phosphate isomerase-like protein (cupin superfamily)
MSDELSGSGSEEEGKDFVGPLGDFVLGNQPGEYAPFRRVLCTTKQEQYVAMTLRPADRDLGRERHEGTTITYYVLSGRGEISHGAPRKHQHWKALTAGTIAIVSPDSWHNVRIQDDAQEPLVFLATYSPPHLPRDLVQLGKPTNVRRRDGYNRSCCINRGGDAGHEHELWCDVCRGRLATMARQRRLPWEEDMTRVEFLCDTCNKNS